MEIIGVLILILFCIYLLFRQDKKSKKPLKRQPILKNVSEDVNKFIKTKKGTYVNSFRKYSIAMRKKLNGKCIPRSIRRKMLNSKYGRT